MFTDIEKVTAFAMGSFVRKLFLVIFVVLSTSVFSVESKGTGGVVVKTIPGPVTGETEKGVFVFRGIRYAASPLGPLRFRPPTPPTAWSDGGYFMEGSARNTWYDGAKLAERGDLVVVTVQYRMGAWGFLDVSDMGGQDFAQSANVGLLDQIAALKWVKENIAAFGGDPNNVTLFGQSAGAGSVGMMMVMPSARGLFHKAIMESGTPKELNDNCLGMF